MDGWVQVPEPLTIQQRFRLVEIMHETKDDAVKAAAADLLTVCWLPRYALFPRDVVAVPFGDMP